jgi:hypothetical protein
VSAVRRPKRDQVMAFLRVQSGGAAARRTTALVWLRRVGFPGAAIVDEGPLGDLRQLAYFEDGQSKATLELLGMSMQLLREVAPERDVMVPASFSKLRLVFEIRAAEPNGDLFQGEYTESEGVRGTLFHALV